jgi:hypothetical protein
LSDHAKSVVVKVSEAVGTALNELHFSVKAFGDAVVFGEAPHQNDGFDHRLSADHGATHSVGAGPRAALMRMMPPPNNRL